MQITLLGNPMQLLLFKKNLNASKPSEFKRKISKPSEFREVVSHIQRIGCQPEKTTSQGGQSCSARGLLNRGEKKSLVCVLKSRNKLLK